MHAASKPVARPHPVVPFLRVVREPSAIPAPVKIREPLDVVKILRPLLDDQEVESFYVVLLDAQSNVRGLSLVTRGLLNSTLIAPREVFSLAIAFNAGGIIVAHNHPSGDPTPSTEDRAVTRQLLEAGRLLDIPLYDHLILAGDRFVSFASDGLLS